MADRDEIIEFHQKGMLPELIVQAMRGHRSDEEGNTFRAELAALHNAGHLDALEAARSIGSSPIVQHDFFTVMLAYCDLIPELSATVPAMLAAVKGLVARAGDDGAAGMPNAAFRKWAEREDRARLTLDATDPSSRDDAPYIFIALQALAKNQPGNALTAAVAYLGGPEGPARAAAAKALGTIDLSTPELQRVAFEALAAAGSEADDDSLGHVLTALCEIMRAHPETEQAGLEVIDRSMPAIGSQTIHQLSLELMFHGEELSPTVVAALTSITLKVSAESRGTLENLDAAAGKFIRAGRVDEGLALIVPLISQQDQLTSLEALDSFSHALLGLEPAEAGKVIANWLLSNEINLGHAAMALVGEYHGDGPLILDVDATSMSGSDMILLAHRAIGYLFVYPITAASLVLALLRVAAEDAREVITEILFDPLLINYSGELAEWLRRQAENRDHPAHPAIEVLLKRLEEYIAGLRNADRIAELRPSERERLIENHRQHESMRQAHKLAEKKSVFLSIVSRSVLLYGNRSISYFDGPDGESSRNEMKMHSFSHSYEAPRLDILEPFDLDYTLRTFRVMRKAKS